MVKQSPKTSYKQIMIKQKNIKSGM